MSNMSSTGSIISTTSHPNPVHRTMFGGTKPPSTAGVKLEDFPNHIQLGEHKLEIDSQGNWKTVGGGIEHYQAQIRELTARIEKLQHENLLQQSQMTTGGPKGTASMFELEKRAIEWERKYMQKVQENNELHFKTKVLMAMCTISEGDYQALCKEAGFQPRSKEKQPAGSTNQPQETSGREREREREGRTTQRGEGREQI